MQLEDAVASRGQLKLEWIRRMQEVARTLDGRATDRLLTLAHQDEAAGIMNRDGNAQEFGLI